MQQYWKARELLVWWLNSPGNDLPWWCKWDVFPGLSIQRDDEFGFFRRMTCYSCFISRVPLFADTYQGNASCHEWQHQGEHVVGGEARAKSSSSVCMGCVPPFAFNSSAICLLSYHCIFVSSLTLGMEEHLSCNYYTLLVIITYTHHAHGVVLQELHQSLFVWEYCWFC